MSSSGGSISSYIGGKAAAVAAVVALAVVGVTVPVVTGGGGGGAATANLWVDTNGGTCARQASPAAYSDAAACSTFTAAYQAASCGDQVYVKAGTYGSQTVNRHAAKDACGSRVVIEEAPSESVTIGDFSSGEGGSCCPLPTEGVDHLEIKGISLGSMYLIGNPLTDFHATDIDANGRFTIQGADDSSITGGDWGPCTATEANKACPMLIEADSAISNDGLLIEGNTIHDIRCDGQPWDCHIECMKINGGENLTIRGNVYRDCALYDIFMKSEQGRSFAGLLIENNQFDVTWNEDFPGATQTRQQGVSFSCGAGELEDAIIRFNSFHEGSALDPDEDGCGRNSNVLLVGNVVGGSACTESTGSTWQYNVYVHGDPCSGTGNVTLSDFPYVDEATDGNFRLTGAATTIDGRVPTSVTGGCAATDIDGDARPASGSTCDAGMDER